LGQTELTVKAGQVGTSNATKPSNLGMFDYAHLRVPLPKDLQGSGIFVPSRRNQTFPEAYFLMRRSNDGYISATGMYKAAFPWSSLEEEETEKRYIKSLPETDSEEVAGNVWIPEDAALTLADMYGMRPWIEALLDPEPIAMGSHDPNKSIATPPRFLAHSEATTLLPPTEKTSRRRTLRSSSPAKAPLTPSRKIATPRRTRRAKPSSSALATTAESAGDSVSVEPEAAKFDSIIASSEALAKAEAETDSVLEEALGHPRSARSTDDTVKVDIETITEPAVNGRQPVTTTHVTVETPANHPDLIQPADAQAYLDQAKEAIIAANRLTAGRASGKKRKAVEAFVDDDEEPISAFPDFDALTSSAAVAPAQLVVQRPAKRQRITEIELRKEKIKKRATIGIATSLAFG
jgi:hypothetical protein